MSQRNRQIVRNFRQVPFDLPDLADLDPGAGGRGLKQTT